MSNDRSDSSFNDLQLRLALARRRLEQASKLIQQIGKSWDDFWAAHEAVLFAEREVAAAAGFECVAESFKVELFEESFTDILARVCRRLTS